MLAKKCADRCNLCKCVKGGITSGGATWCSIWAEWVNLAASHSCDVFFITPTPTVAQQCPTSIGSSLCVSDLTSALFPKYCVGVLFKVIWKPLLCRHPFLRHQSALSAKRKRKNSKDSSFERSKEPGYCVGKCPFEDRICAWARRDRIFCPKMLEIWTQICCKFQFRKMKKMTKIFCRAQRMIWQAGQAHQLYDPPATAI